MGSTPTVENFFSLLLFASFAVPLALFPFTARNLKNRSEGFSIALYCAFFLLYNLFFDQLESSLGNGVYYYIYTVLEFSLFASLIAKADSSARFKKTNYLLSVVFLVFCTWRLLFKNKERMDSYEIAGETLILLSLIMYFFYIRFKEVDEKYLYQNHYFWLMMGILVYLGFTFFFNILVNHIDIETGKNYYHFSFVGDIIKNILFAVSIFYMPRRSGAENRVQSFNAPKLDLI